jgi:hypothetical protein
MSIKPGTSVDIVLDPATEGIKPMKALVYEVAGKCLVLSQTSPPIRSQPPHRPLYVTYLVRQGNRMRRMGFTAAVAAFCDDYPLLSGTRVPAVSLEMEGAPEETSLRKSFRIRTPSNCGLTLTIDGRNYAIFEISLTGIGFIQPLRQPAFKPSASLECRLNIDGRSYPLKARVIRAPESAASRRIAAAFVGIGQEMQPVLSRKILLLERRELSRQD